MDLIKECILLKDPSTFSFDSPDCLENPFAIGILLSMPLQSTSLDLLSSLLSLAKNDKNPSIVRLGSLCKFFRHFSDIQRYVNLKSSQHQVISLLSTGCEYMNQIFTLQESPDLKDFLIKSFKRSIERLTFEYRTQIQVLQLVSCAMKYKIFSDFPSLIFKIPTKVIENALNFQVLPYSELLSTIEDIWRLIKSFHPPDFDPIKNVGFFLVSELVHRTETLTMALLSDLLFSYSGQMNKAQEFKVLHLYKGLCEKIGFCVNDDVCSKLGELKKQELYEPSAWDLVEETPVYMDVVSIETLPETVLRVIDQLKMTHSKEYLKYEIIEKEILSISKTYRKDQGAIFQSIATIVEKDDKSKLRFWKTFTSAARKLRFFTFEQTKGLWDLIDKVEKESGRTARSEYVKKVMSADMWKEKVEREVADCKMGKSEIEKVSCEVQRFEEMVQEEFPLCEIQPIGSIQYKLFQKDSAVDLLILGQTDLVPDFLPSLLTFLKLHGDTTITGSIIHFKSTLHFNLHYTSRIPQLTCRLIERYNQSQTINTFLHYTKLWGRSQNLPDPSPKGYFWTLLSIFFLCSTSPPVLKNLLISHEKDLEMLEGFNTWTDPNDYPPLEVPLTTLIQNFFQFLSANLNSVFNLNSGTTHKNNEFVWAVADLFTEKLIGIPACEMEKLEKAVKNMNDDLVGCSN